jgi:hypothetical protein
MRRFAVLGVMLTAATSAVVPQLRATAGTNVNFITANTGPSDSTAWLVHTGSSNTGCNNGTANQAYGPLGIGTPANPRWNIAQWGSPCDLGTTASDLGGGAWASGNGVTAAVQYNPLSGGNQLVQMSQNGTTIKTAPSTYWIPCRNGGPVPENDLIISPNVPSAYLPPATGGPIASNLQTTGPTLAQLQSVTVTVGAELTYESITPRCNLPADPDYGFATVGVTLTDYSTSQVLFYQVILRDSRCAGHQDCPSNLSNEGDFFDHACGGGNVIFQNGDPNGTPATGWYYGVSETLVSAGNPLNCLIPGGGRQFYTLSVGSRIDAWIQTGIWTPQPGSPTIDRNLNNWIITGLYVGSGIQGSAVTTSRYDSINMTGVCVSTC